MENELEYKDFMGKPFSGYSFDEVIEMLRNELDEKKINMAFADGLITRLQQIHNKEDDDLK